MATRYMITLVREEYLPINDLVTGRVTLEGGDHQTVREALAACVKQCVAWGWLPDDADTPTGDA